MKHFEIMGGCYINDWHKDYPKLAALCSGEPFTVYDWNIAHTYNKSGEFMSRGECVAPDDAIPVFELPA